jgi:hypothetical protein
MSKATESEIIAEVEKLQSLGKDDLRVRWSKMFGKTPPPALTKDLLGRMIAWRIQEKVPTNLQGFTYGPWGNRFSGAGIHGIFALQMSGSG